LEDRAVDPGAGLLELGDHVEDAPMPDQAPADGVLKLVVEEILQRLHSSSLQAPTVLPAVVGGRSSVVGQDAVAIILTRSCRCQRRARAYALPGGRFRSLER